MNLKRILAVIRPEKQHAVEEALKTAGVPGVTISKVVGFGESVNLFRSDWHMAHVRLVVYAKGEDVNRICQVIHDAAHTGASGDGFIAVIPVERFDRLREGPAGAHPTPDRSSPPRPTTFADEEPSKSSALVWIILVIALASLAAVYFVSPLHRNHAYVVAIGMTLALSLVSTTRRRPKKKT